MTPLRRSFLAAVSLSFASLAFAADGEWEYPFKGATHGDFYFDFAEETKPEDVFAIGEDGTLTIKGKGKPEGFIQTLDEYGDYELQFEWRWIVEPPKRIRPGEVAPPAKPAKSGLLLHCSDSRYYGVWPRCIETQIATGDVGDFQLFGESLTVAEESQHSKLGSESSRRLKLLDAENRPGEWNAMRIEAKGDTLAIYLNRKTVNKATELSAKRGYIAIQAQGSDLEIRAFRIRELD